MADVSYNFVQGSQIFVKTGGSTTPTSDLSLAKVVSTIQRGFIIGDGNPAEAGTFPTIAGHGYRVTIEEITLLTATQIANLETALSGDTI